jgi:hypothetical protein
MHPLVIFERAKPYKNGAYDWTCQRTKMPPWIKAGSQFQCPACQQRFDYNGPFNPLRFRCPMCNQQLTWREMEQLEPYEKKICQKCKGDMVKRNGKYGEFYGCENYPKCKSTRHKKEIRLRHKCRVTISGEKNANDTRRSKNLLGRNRVGSKSIDRAKGQGRGI